MKFSFGFCAFLFVLLLLGSCRNSKVSDPQPILLEQIMVSGDIKSRITGNLDRIEQQLFWPKNILAASDSSEWPGSLEGRTILAWVLDGRALRRNPIYLEPLMSQLSEHFNERGYMGSVYADGMMNEQQMAGNSWLLRGLCAYYAWSTDESVKEKTKGYIRSIVDNLFLAHKGAYQEYPLDRVLNDSVLGPETGTIVQTKGKWMLSSDVGSLFVALDGLSDAYSILKDPAIKEVFTEMTSRFLAMDLVKSQAQTHAVLSAMRGLLRFSSLTGDKQYVASVQKLWLLYSRYGMSELYGCYNWFGRYDSWSDPNAVIDSYMLATQLWTMTRNVHYLEDAELIYVNAFVQAQRPTGGFGSENNAIAIDPYMTRHTLEIPFTGTLRGAEGLTSVLSSSYYTNNDTLFVPFIGSSNAAFAIAGGTVTILQETEYPQVPSAVFTISGVNSSKIVMLLPVRPWNHSYKLSKNGLSIDVPVKNGFIEVPGPLKNGDRIELSFVQQIVMRDPLNKQRTLPGQFRAMCGSMVLSYDLPAELKLTRRSKLSRPRPTFFDIEGTGLEMTPVYHVYSGGVDVNEYYRKKILF